MKYFTNTFAQAGVLRPSWCSSPACILIIIFFPSGVAASGLHLTKHFIITNYKIFCPLLLLVVDQQIAAPPKLNAPLQSLVNLPLNV